VQADLPDDGNGWKCRLRSNNPNNPIGKFMLPALGLIAGKQAGGDYGPGASDSQHSHGRHRKSHESVPGTASVSYRGCATTTHLVTSRTSLRSSRLVPQP
jgi:hypothetical protein